MTYKDKKKSGKRSTPKQNSEKRNEEVEQNTASSKQNKKNVIINQYRPSWQTIPAQDFQEVKKHPAHPNQNAVNRNKVATSLSNQNKGSTRPSTPIQEDNIRNISSSSTSGSRNTESNRLA